MMESKLAMMPRPRGGDWLEDEIIKLKRQDIDIVVSLLESMEEFNLELSKEQHYCKKHKIQFINYPIKDRGIPEDRVAYNELIGIIYQSLKAYKSIVVHCRMGIGRTSLLCASILLKCGLKVETIFPLLSEIRTLKVPDTQEQEDWVMENREGR